MNFEQIRNLFLCNGYHGEFIADTINLAVNKFMNNNRLFGPSKCPVYVRLPWIGSTSQLIANKVISSVARCHNVV